MPPLPYGHRSRNLPLAELAESPPTVAYGQVRPIALALAQLGVPEAQFFSWLGCAPAARSAVPAVFLRDVLADLSVRLATPHLAIAIAQNRLACHSTCAVRTAFNLPIFYGVESRGDDWIVFGRVDDRPGVELGPFPTRRAARARIADERREDAAAGKRLAINISAAKNGEGMV